MQAVIENSDSSSSSNDVNTLIDSDVKHKIIKWYLTSYENTPLSMPLNQHRALLQPYRRIANLLKKLTLSDFMIKKSALHSTSLSSSDSCSEDTSCPFTSGVTKLACVSANKKNNARYTISMHHLDFRVISMGSTGWIQISFLDCTNGLCCPILQSYECA